MEEKNTEDALTKREQHPDQEELRDGMRADEKSEAENEVMNERRERENEWEEWTALEQEIDELGSGGEEEGEKKDAQTERWQKGMDEGEWNRDGGRQTERSKDVGEERS